ncbi:MAG: sigma-70 family RNA polymerase sigma factor [Myxococcales bacterium]
MELFWFTFLMAVPGASPARRPSEGVPLEGSAPSSWRSFFEEHWRFVTRVVRRFGGPEIEVEDAVQDVFLVLFERLQEFKGEAELRTWIYRICANVAAEHRRKARRGWRMAEVLGRLPFLSIAASPASTVEARHELAVVERILSQMSEKRREAFVLCELEQLSGEEAAEVLRIPVATVRTRHHYARKDFLALMKRLEGAP